MWMFHDVSHTYPNIHSGHNWNRYPRRENLECELWLSFQNFSLSVTSSNSQVVTAHGHLESILVVEHEGASSINGNSGIPRGSSGSVGYHYGKAATGEGAILCPTSQTSDGQIEGQRSEEHDARTGQGHGSSSFEFAQGPVFEEGAKFLSFWLSGGEKHTNPYCNILQAGVHSDIFLSMAPFGSTPQPCMTTVPPIWLRMWIPYVNSAHKHDRQSHIIYNIYIYIHVPSGKLT